jgi:hypothetical protein
MASSSRTWMCSACGVVVKPRDNGRGEMGCPYCGGPVALVLENGGSAAAAAAAAALPGARSRPSPQPLGATAAKSTGGKNGGGGGSGGGSGRASARPTTPQDALSGLGRIVPSSPWVPDAADPPASSEAIGDQHAWERRAREAESRSAPPPATPHPSPPPTTPAPAPARRRRGEPEWWRSPWTLMAAGGILIAAIIIYVVDNDSGKQQGSPQAAGGQPTSTTSTPKQDGAAPAAAAATSAPAPQPHHVNLLDRIQVERDTISGNWEMKPEGLVCDEAKPAKLKITYQPPAEYDYVVEFTRFSGDDCVVQIFTHSGRVIAWLMSGWKGTTSGFQLVNDKPVIDKANGTSVKGAILSSGQRYTSVVKVRKDSVEAWLDGKLIKRHVTDGKDLSTDPYWDVKTDPLGLGAYGSSTIFHKVEVVEMGAGG